MGDPPREFRITEGFGRIVWSYRYVLVALFVISGVISMVALEWWGAIVIGGSVTGLFVGSLFLYFRRIQAGTVVKFSERGVEYRDWMGFRVRLWWPDMTRIDEVEMRLSSPYERHSRKYWHSKTKEGLFKLQGLVGWGERIMPPGLPMWVFDKLAAAPRNSADGRPEVSVPLGLVDADWQRTDMGELVRRHRPDLFDDDAT